MIDLSMLPDFIAEASEHLEEMESDLLHLEDAPDNPEILNDIFRAAHTIKGSAEYLGMVRIAELSHKLENLLEMLRHGERTANREIIDTLIESRDRIAMLTEDLERSEAEKTDTSDLIDRIDRLAENLPESEAVSEPAAEAGKPEPADADASPDDLGTCENPETIDMDAVQKYYEELKLVLYKMTRGDLSDENRDRVVSLLENFISISGCLGDDRLMDNLNSMKRQAALLAFPDDAGDMLADLHRFMNFLTPQPDRLPPADSEDRDHHAAPDHPVFPDAIDEDRLFEKSEDDEEEDLAGLQLEPDTGPDEEGPADEDLFPDDSGDTAELSFENQEDETEEQGFLTDIPEDDEFLPGMGEDDADLTFDDDIVSEEAAAVASGADDRIRLAEDAIYDDEYDDELFDIFIQHLRENIAFIRNQTDALHHSADKSEELSKCLGYLNGLKSSANYMDYRNLTRFYERWMAEIDKLRERLSLGEAVAFASPEGVKDDVAAGMEAYVREVLEHFPQAAGSDAETADVSADAMETTRTQSDDDTRELLPTDPDRPDAEADEPAVSDVSDTPEPEDSEIPDEADVTEAGWDDLFSADMAESEAPETDRMPEEEPPPAEAPRSEADDAAEKAHPEPADYQGLFGELDDAFDSLTDDLESESEPEPEAAPEDLEDQLAAAPATTSAPPLSDTDPGDRQADTSDWKTISEAIRETPAEPSDPPAVPDLAETESPVLPESPEPEAEQPPEIPVPPEPVEEPLAEAETASPILSEPAESEAEQPPEIPVPPELGSGPETDDISVKPPDHEASEPLSEKLVRKQNLRVDARKIDSLMNQVGELVVSRAWFSQLYNEMRELQQHLHENVGLDQREMKPVRALTFKISEATVALGRVANELQEGVMKVRMLPIAQLFNRYPRLVRDLTHDTDKEVRLDIVGEETELDKMVIEEISDPLVHIIRNAVDHGCESVPERRRLGKPESCTLKLESYHESNHVVIEISDDGRGISPELVRQKALEKNFFSQDELERMGHRELMGIIMKPGFSTSETISKTSGRGVGMDVVRKNIEKLNGTIEVDSKTGVGTRFRIKIPLTLAIIQALLVRVGGDIFTIPLSAVEETLRVFEDDISLIEGIEVVQLRGNTLSLLRLSEIFGIESNAQDSRKAFVVVVNTGMREVGLVVDSLIGQEEAVIKPLVDYLQENSGFSGATILGDGRISLILDVYELVNMSIGRRTRAKADMGALEMGEFPSAGAYEQRTLH